MYKYKLASNNLDFLRLLLASAVVILHLSHLSGNPIIASYSESLEFLSKRAVPGFFIISGFLIYMSYEYSKNMESYIWKRMLRIYPAYIVLIFLCAFCFFYLAELSTEDYFNINWIKYLVSNLTFLVFLKPTLPGVFQEHHIQVVNGALWTLKIEVMFYLLVPLIFKLVKIFSAKKVIVFMYVSSLAYNLTLEYLSDFHGMAIFKTLQNQLPGQMTYFTAGIFAYLYFELVKRYIRYFLIAAFVTFYIEIQALEPIALMSVLIFVFMILDFKIDLSKIGDVSYGVYIYHFPIIQVLIALNVFQDSPVLLVLFTYLLTFTFALASWKLIEQRANRHKNFNISKLLKTISIRNKF